MGFGCASFDTVGRQGQSMDDRRLLKLLHTSLTGVRGCASEDPYYARRRAEQDGSVQRTDCSLAIFQGRKVDVSTLCFLLGRD